MELSEPPKASSSQPEAGESSESSDHQSDQPILRNKIINVLQHPLVIGSSRSVSVDHEMMVIH